MKAKAPIQIQRDNLLAQVGELQKSITQKDITIKSLQDELALNRQVILEKNQLLAQVGELQKSITQKDVSIKSLQEQFENLNRQFDDLQNDVVVVGEDFSHLLSEE
jgi:peptidoglycan hydrolase CwlO-like protein